MFFNQCVFESIEGFWIAALFSTLSFNRYADCGVMVVKASEVTGVSQEVNWVTLLKEILETHTYTTVL